LKLLKFLVEKMKILTDTDDFLLKTHPMNTESLLKTDSRAIFYEIVPLVKTKSP
jgi:uncharacterized membrane-anchored protein